jgi:hypothetical protein
MVNDNFVGNGNINVGNGRDRSLRQSPYPTEARDTI